MIEIFMSNFSLVRAVIVTFINGGIFVIGSATVFSVENLSLKGIAIASSAQKDARAANNAIDGDASDSSRWISQNSAGPHWLEVRFENEVTINCAHIYSGYRLGSALKNFHLEYWKEDSWKVIKGSRVQDSPAHNISVSVLFDELISSKRIRLICEDGGYTRVKELALFYVEGDEVLDLGVGIAGNKHIFKKKIYMR